MSTDHHVSWSFNRLSDMEGVKSLTSRVTSTDLRPLAPPAGAVVAGPAQSYPIHHLLGLPYEIRLVLIELMSNSVLWSSRQPFYGKPKDDYSGFWMACRQTYFEMKLSWHRYIVPWQRLQQLLETKFNRTLIRKYESLSIELPVNAHTNYFTGLAAVLFKAQPYLRVLRLYFFGDDLYDDELQRHGCGKLQRRLRKPKVGAIGKRWKNFLPLWKRIAALSRLEVLVISNPDLQIFEPMVLMKKPFLKYLYLSTDPRSLAHTHYSTTELGFLLTCNPPDCQYPPIRFLHIAANATLSSNSLVAKVAETLEHLTWVVPDHLFDESVSDYGQYTRTAQLIHALRRKGTRLHTMRICLQGAPVLDNAQNGTLIGSIKTHLPHFGGLKNLEIHVKSRSQWFGKEIVARLPNSVENIYLSDECLKPRDMLHQVWERFLVATCIDSVNRGIPDVTFISHDLKPAIEYHQNDSIFNRFVQEQDHGPWLVSLDPYRQYHVNVDEATPSAVLQRHRSNTDLIDHPGYFDDPRYIHTYRRHGLQVDLIGGSGVRRDYIPFHTGQLRFVHYEFAAHNPDDSDDSFPPTLLATLLVNGRLLDKARNSHLSKYNGAYIPPNDQQQQRAASSDETATHSAHIGYAMLLHQLYEVESTCPSNIAMYQSELQESSQLEKDVAYFGQEQEAVRVFEDEYITRINELQEYCYPVEKHLEVDGRCHWMSPQPVIQHVDG